MAILTPSPKMQFFDSNGNPLSGGKLYTYISGTTTPLATYTDSTGGTPNANPVVLDSRGEASVWLAASSLYYMELKTSADVLVWTADNVGDVATSNLSMGGYKFTSLGSGTARTDSINLGQVQDGKINWIAAGGTADAITATYSPAITALVDGQLCYVRATAANATTTPTFAPNGLTARTIVQLGGVALVAGSISGVGHELILRYDLSNTRWELLNPATARIDQVSLYPTVASAATLDPFAAVGATLGISGTTTVTAITACSAAQVGSTKTMIPSNAAGFSITASASIVVDGATSGTYLMPHNAIVRILATSTTTFSITTVFASGSWTPSVGGTSTYSQQSGIYTKIGNRVFLDYVMILTSLGTGSTTTISGLPFTSANNSQISYGTSNTVNCATAIVSEAIYIAQNSTTINLIGRTAASVSPTAPLTAFGAVTGIRGSINYQV